jgi:hypothetical protein
VIRPLKQGPPQEPESSSCHNPPKKRSS